LVTITEQCRISINQILKEFHDSLRTQHILLKPSMKWRSTSTNVGSTNPTEVLQELVERKMTVWTAEIPRLLVIE
jgi:D-lyxose ketol-isomerase